MISMEIDLRAKWLTRGILAFTSRGNPASADRKIHKDLPCLISTTDDKRKRFAELVKINGATFQASTHVVHAPHFFRPGRFHYDQFEPIDVDARMRKIDK